VLLLFPFTFSIPTVGNQEKAKDQRKLIAKAGWLVRKACVRETFVTLDLQWAKLFVRMVRKGSSKQIALELSCSRTFSYEFY
jgi:hypothetical protein